MSATYTPEERAIRVVGTSALKEAPRRAVQAAPHAWVPPQRRRRHLVLVPGGAGLPQRVLPWSSDVVSRPTHLARPAARRDVPAGDVAGAAQPDVHLTVRGRFVARLVVVLGFIGLVVSLSGYLVDPATSANPGSAGNSRAVMAVTGGATQAGAGVSSLQQVGGRLTLTVAPADTLWAIAGRVAPKADRRDVVEVIKAANGLSGSSVRAGQVLEIPAGVAGTR